MRIATSVGIGFAGLSLALLADLSANALEENTLSLRVLWSTNIVGAPQPFGSTGVPDFGRGLILQAQSVSPDGSIVWLANRIAPQSRSSALVLDAERAGPDSGVVLNLGAHQQRTLFSRFFGGNTQIQKPSVSTMAVGPNGEIWVAGSTNSHYDWTSYRHSDAYLAMVDTAGEPLWERTYNNGGRRTIRGLTRMTSGDLAVAGLDDWDGWLARIRPDGSQLWERHLGNDLNNAVASLPNDRLVVVGFESTGSGSTNDYQNHVSAWIVDGSGNVLAKTRIRESISPTMHAADFGPVFITTTSDAIYVASSWSDLFKPQPVEIAKLRHDGTLLWNVVLPDTVRANATAHPTWTTCSPALAVTPGEDLVVACSLQQIQIYKVDGRSGTYHENYLSLPDCDAHRSAVDFLVIRNNGAVVLSGSRPPSVISASCTWIGHVTGNP
jgi:hypothetical protein